MIDAISQFIHLVRSHPQPFSNAFRVLQTNEVVYSVHGHNIPRHNQFRRFRLAVVDQRTNKIVHYVALGKYPTVLTQSTSQPISLSDNAGSSSSSSAFSPHAQR